MRLFVMFLMGVFPWPSLGPQLWPAKAWAAGAALPQVASTTDAADTAADGPSQPVIVATLDDAAVNSPREDLRKKLFPNTLDVPSCQVLKVHPQGDLGGLDNKLQELIQGVMRGITKHKATDLIGWFHPRLKVGIPALEDALGKIDLMVVPPKSASLFRLWALNTVDGTVRGLDCAGDGAVVYPQYGYPLQFAAWFSVLGKAEVARVYVSIVPTERWNLGAFHQQQWTHAEKDPAAWAEAARADLAQGNTESAYAKFDLAAKLADGGKFLELAMQKDALAQRDAVMSRQAWEASLQALIKSEKVEYMATLLVTGGAGVLARLRVDGEISLDDMKKRCQGIVSAVGKSRWSKGLVGMRCSYLLPKEAADKEGALGGLFLAFSPDSAKAPLAAP